METNQTKKVLIIAAHALVGWALCGAVMGIGMALTSVENAIILHAALAPVIFAAVSWNYFTRFNYTTPLQTASIFLATIILMDFFVVAMLINRSFEMFTSPLGTWIPFALIFLSTYLTGWLVTTRSGSHAAAQ